MVATKTLMRDLLRHAGIEVLNLKTAVTEETTLRKLIANVNPVAVLDVGANLGQYAHLLRKLGYGGTIVSFEALTDVHAKLVDATKSDSSWIAAPCAALGGAKTTARIHVAKNSVSSSLLPMRDTHVKAAPGSAYVDEQVVSVERLDELARDLVPAEGNLLLKIDTQGYEREVLKGATGLMQRVAALQVEMSLIPLYDGAPAFSEMTAYIEQLDFEFFSIVPGFRNLQTGRLLQVDGFFVRK